jgi:pimeloyl-ACP methyl ester carboxylesterase
VNGIETSYEIIGSGTPVALYIHGGFGGASTTLAPRERAIGNVFPPDEVTTIAYDRRSVGQSEYVLTHYRLPDLAADARALLGRLEIDRSVVIGDSMGGMVALEYALTYPRHVSALVLVETGADLMSEMPMSKRLRDIVGRAEAEGDLRFIESQMHDLRNPTPTSEGMGPETQEAQQNLARNHQTYLDALREVSDTELIMYTTGMIRNTAAFIGYDYTSRLSELRMPVCVIHGTADVTVPFECGQTLHRGIPHSELIAIEGARHQLLDYPEAAAALREWVLRTVKQVAATDKLPRHKAV